MAHSTPAGSDAGRNLLFGMLALKMRFVSLDALIAAMNRALSKEQALGGILVEQGVLPADVRDQLEMLVDHHVRMRDGDTPRSLSAPASVDRSGETLKEVFDHDVLASARQTLEELDWRRSSADSVAAPSKSPTRFRILRHHAQGGVGEVFVARDEELNRPVALKEIQPRYAEDPVSRSRFLLEAEITGGLEHPGIVPVYSLGTYADGRPYYAMRLIEGHDLREAIERFHAADKAGRDPGERSLAFRELLGRFVDVCNAVAFAHSKGVLHRDLKPANIMLGKYGETLVVDWGLAKISGRIEGPGPSHYETNQPRALGELTPTHQGSALGTPAFMSPEQASGQLQRQGPASDIYSLGATLYSLLTGQAPVNGASLNEVLQKVQRGEVLPARRVKPGTPAALEAICKKAMALDPNDRYATALDLAAEIEHWLADEPVAASRETFWVRARRWGRRHRPLVVGTLAAAFVAVLLGSAGLVWLQREQARRRAGAEVALEKARELQTAARWADARVALEQAEERLSESGPPDLRRRIESTKSELELVARLDDLRTLRALGPHGGSGDRVANGQKYQEIFAEAGLGSPSDPPASVATRIRSSPVSEVLVAALDDWALIAAGPTRAWALEAARLADPNPWRDRLRDPAAWDDEQRLAKLAKETPPAEVPPGLAGAVGGRLRRTGEGEELLRTAQALQPGDFWLNLCLGAVLRAKGQWREAECFDRAALALRPGSAVANNCLGISLYHQDKLNEAADKYRTAMELDPKDGYSRFNLTRVLLALGLYPQAGEAARRAYDLLPVSDPLHPQTQDLMRQARLGERLPAVLRGDDRATSASECAAFGELCFAQQRYVAAVRLFRDAFAADPKLATDLRTKHRYNAACYAALAACGRGKDASELTGEERAQLRAQALTWLRADLVQRLGQLEGSQAERAESAKKLRLWLRDEDLAGVRDAAALSRLPEAERKDWEAFWAEVKATLAKHSANK